MKIKKAVLPVAGFGTRFLPITKSQPKEMLPIVDKPVIHYLVEEAVKSGITEIIIVTGRGKRAIEDYFDQSFELEHTLVENGKIDLLNEVLEIPNMAKFIYVRQSVPRGDGDAILQAKSLLGDEPFVVLFGDDLVFSEVPATQQLMQEYEEGGSPVVAYVEVKKEDVDKYGILEVTDGVVGSIVEKPKVTEAKSTLALIGKYILNSEVLEILSELSEKEKFAKKELKLADALAEYIARGGCLKAKKITGERFDAGSKIGLLKASLYVGLNHKETAEELKEYIKEVSGRA